MSVGGGLAVPAARDVSVRLTGADTAALVFGTIAAAAAALSAREARADDWICLECEETSEPEGT